MILSLFSCNGSKRSAHAEAKDNNEAAAISAAQATEAAVEKDAAETNKATDDSTMRFIVSFYSIGSGISRGMPEKLESFVEKYGLKINQKIIYNKTHWGREGETDYCFPLKELSDAQISEFIMGAKEELKSAEYVHFLENQECRKGR